MGRDQIAGIRPTDANMFQPTRPHGARPRRKPYVTTLNRFNPRARMGRDLSSIYIPLIDSQFQPTRPHGARLNFASKN